MIRWLLVGAGVLALYLVFIYSLCRIAAAADLRAMHDYAALPKRATDPWEEPSVRGGVYDAVARGDFDG